ncbi:MAG TPA: OmpA family protein [Fontimonas sp.]
MSGLGFKPATEGWQLTLPERLSFEFNKAELAPELRDSLTDSARQLLAVDIKQLRVEGHTDNVGSREYNQELSLRRAESVAAVLIASGFATGNVETEGYGADRPAADNATEEGRAQNRRVEIIVASRMLAAR